LPEAAGFGGSFFYINRRVTRGAVNRPYGRISCVKAGKRSRDLSRRPLLRDAPIKRQVPGENLMPRHLAQFIIKIIFWSYRAVADCPQPLRDELRHCEASLRQGGVKEKYAGFAVRLACIMIVTLCGIRIYFKIRGGGDNVLLDRCGSSNNTACSFCEMTLLLNDLKIIEKSIYYLRRVVNMFSSFHQCRCRRQEGALLTFFRLYCEIFHKETFQV
jgi:hypothetical protein